MKMIQNQYIQLFLAQMKETVREPAVLFWGIIFPILMSLGLGIAFSQKTDTQRKVAIITDHRNDQGVNVPKPLISDFLARHQACEYQDANSGLCRKITIKDDKLGSLTILFMVTDLKTAMTRLKQGELNLVLDEQNGKVEYHFDPMNPDAQLTYLKLSRMIDGQAGDLGKISENIEPMTVSGTRYIDFLVPGLICMGVMMSSMWGISYNIIDKRSKKLLRRMVATPMRKPVFLAAMISVRTCMNTVEALLLYVFAALVFHINIQGSIPALIMIFVAGNIVFAGVAVFISSRTPNTEVGNGLINVVVMPMMVLSGIFFSYHNFPDWAIPVIRFMPLTVLADGMRSIFTEGAGFGAIVVPSLILAFSGILLFSAGLKIFRWH